MHRASIVALVAAAVWPSSALGAPVAGEGIHKIQHVVMIMQENRSFDHYFGTYPGANGIPGGVCEPDPQRGGCVAPFHNPSDQNYGGPHELANAIADVAGGRMDGFVGQSQGVRHCTSNDPNCSPCSPTGGGGPCVDVMGYHDAREIPNYWAYAQNFVLQDNLFASSMSWSLPEHLFQVSGWSAACPDGGMNPMACANSLGGPWISENPTSTYSWTDITYPLYKAGVSWAYYIFNGTEPDCASDSVMTCAPVPQASTTPGIWNPLPRFTDVKQDRQLQNIQSLSRFYSAVHSQGACGLPNVSWVIPNSKVSEHPPRSLVSTGQAYVTTLVNSIMESPCWSSTAIFISWDEWGGFYDHVAPPSIDQNGYGLRVPGLVISPYAKAGYIDHQQLSHDAYLKFIEDDFLGGQRLNPATDGRPDLRPSVREEAPGLGNLESDFNFNQPPRPPLILQTHPSPGPASNPPGYVPPAPPLQVVLSAARRQNLRSQHGHIYLTASCSAACSMFSHGHVSLRHRHRHLRLRDYWTALAAGETLRISLSLSHDNLAAVRRALRRRRPVRAFVQVDARGADGLLQSFRVNVTLSYR